MNGDRSQVLEGSNLGESEADPVGTVYLANTTVSVAFPRLSIPTREQVSAPTFCVFPLWLDNLCLLTCGAVPATGPNASRLSLPKGGRRGAQMEKQTDVTHP